MLLPVPARASILLPSLAALNDSLRFTGNDALILGVGQDGAL